MAPDDLPAPSPKGTDRPAPPPNAGEATLLSRADRPAGKEGGGVAGAAAPETVTPADARARAAAAPADPALVAEILGKAASPARPLRYRGWFSDLPDRGLFIIFLTLGVGAVMTLKLGPFGAETAKWMATAAAAVTLLGYALLAWRADSHRLRGDRLGDNCYYLGFLLTLASMAAALIQFDIATGDRSRVLERLIGSFGVALFSTFLGIALRVVFLQMRREVDDLEEELRRDLNDRAQELKGQLLLAVTELESFRLRTRQVLDERVSEVSDLFAEHSKAQLQEVVRLAQRITEEGSRALGTHTQQALALEEAIRQQAAAAAALAERLGRVEVPPDLFTQEARALSERLGQAGGPLEKSISGLAGRLDALTIPEDWIAVRLAPFTAALAQATAAVERLAQAEVARRTALDEAAARATAAIEAAARDLLRRPSGFFGRLAHVLGWQRTKR